MLGVEAVAQEQLPSEDPLRSLGHHDLLPVRRLPRALGAYREHVLLHRELDGVRIHARNVEADDEAVGVHRHRCLAKSCRGLLLTQRLGNSIHLPEGVEPH